MTDSRNYRGYRFPADIIGRAVWLYHRFTSSFRDIEDLLAERGIDVSYESIRRWCAKFGPGFRRRLKRQEGQLGDTWHVDGVFAIIRGQLHYLWRAVDRDSDSIDILVQRRRSARAAKRFFAKAFTGQGDAPNRLTADKLSSYPPAIREVMLETVHDTSQYANNRAELSHPSTRQHERQIRRFRSRHQAQRFLSLHARVDNLFRYGRHLIRAVNHRLFRARAFTKRRQVTCA